MNKKLQAAEQLRRALQIVLSSIQNDQLIAEVPYVFNEWEPSKVYQAEDIVTYGKNSNGDPALYKILQNHTSQSDWTPNLTPTLYHPIGVDDNGYPIWARPSGAYDAYTVGDIVNFNGILYRNLTDGNIYSPEVYPDGWETYNS